MLSASIMQQRVTSGCPETLCYLLHHDCFLKCSSWCPDLDISQPHAPPPPFPRAYAPGDLCSRVIKDASGHLAEAKSCAGLTCPCPTWRQTLAAPQLQPCWLHSRPSAAKLCSRARHFLSVFLIRDFQICIFLENAGAVSAPYQTLVPASRLQDCTTVVYSATSR